ncbi:MAG: ABC transporter ATP-binding protein [Alphaproteobacteria bacterium]|nr:ABC transporter ATP-binding protein [Alphaproteobacteria bacterium]
MIALATENLCVTLGRRQILHGINLRVFGGEIVGILGPNGAGKSTWLKAVLGLVPLSGGSVTLSGTSLSDLSAEARARMVSYVPQDREVAWSLTVEAIVSLGRLALRPAFAGPSTADSAAIEQAMADADVLRLRGRPITELSGGERARVLIARALAQDAVVLLADEPASGLDPAHQLALLALLRKKAAAGSTVVLTIHELHLAARWCDRLILLHDGRVAAAGLPGDVLTRDNMLNVYGCDIYTANSPQGPVIIPLPISRPEPVKP